MPGSELRHDLALRFAGLALLVLGGAGFDLLFGGYAAPGTCWAGVLASCACLGSASGAALASLGGHVHDTVAISRPWGAALADDWAEPLLLGKASLGEAIAGPAPASPVVTMRAVPPKRRACASSGQAWQSTAAG